jgi:uncharacterized membrane protein YfcA
MELTPIVVIVLLIAFWWSGFVRAGLGFGGAGLMYPIAFLVVDSVIFIVPIVGVHLLVFTTITLARGGYKRVDWSITWKLLFIMLPAKIIGVFGLLQMDDFWLLMAVYGILIVYALGYILNIKAKPSRWLNGPILLFGAYMSGLSLSGAPLIAAVALQYLKKEQAKESMYVLWIVMVVIKLSTLTYYDVDMQWEYHLWLLPAAFVGNYMGSKMHDKIQQMQGEIFYRWMGIALLTLSLIGLSRHLL